MSDYNYFKKPDPRWHLSGINSFEIFISELSVSGKFHKDVPDDVIQEYKAVEHIMAGSYYYYPLYEEAFSKLSRIFEMSVRLRYNKSFQQEYKSEPRTLNEFLRRIGKRLDAELHKEWDKAREIRNYYAHPKKHSFVSPFQLRNACVQAINVINKLHKPARYQKLMNADIDELRKENKQFSNGLFRFVYKGKPILVHGAVPYCYLKEKKISLWMFHPVLYDFPQKVENKMNFSFPLFVKLKNPKISNNTLSGFELETEKKIELVESITDKNLKLKQKFDQMTENASDDVTEMYTNLLLYEMGIQIVNFEYENYWK